MSGFSRTGTIELMSRLLRASALLFSIAVFSASSPFAAAPDDELPDGRGKEILQASCTTCHGLDRVNETRYSPDKWRVTALDMRQRGAKLADEELERLVEWLGRVKGVNPNQ